MNHDLIPIVFICFCAALFCVRPRMACASLSPFFPEALAGIPLPVIAVSAENKVVHSSNAACRELFGKDISGLSPSDVFINAEKFAEFIVELSGSRATGGRDILARLKPECFAASGKHQGDPAMRLTHF